MTPTVFEGEKTRFVGFYPYCSANPQPFIFYQIRAAGWMERMACEPHEVPVLRQLRGLRTLGRAVRSKEEPWSRGVFGGRGSIFLSPV